MVFILYMNYYHSLVVNILRENENLLMVTNSPTILHRFPGGGSEGLSPAVIVTPLENSTQLYNPPSPVPNLPNDPDSDSDPNS